jgi:hypothetical protein
VAAVDVGTGRAAKRRKPRTSEAEPPRADPELLALLAGLETAAGGDFSARVAPPAAGWGVRGTTPNPARGGARASITPSLNSTSVSPGRSAKPLSAKRMSSMIPSRGPAGHSVSTDPS